MMMRRLAKNVSRNTRGTAAVEMALITPLLMALLFGGFEGGTYLWTEQKVIKSVRDGARFAGRQPFSMYTCNTVDSGLKTQIQNLTRTGQISGGTAKIRGWGSDPNDVTVTVQCAGNADSCAPDSGAEYVNKGLYVDQSDGAKTVKVTAMVPYPSLFGLLGFDTSGAKVAASACAAVMGS